ncbi:lipoprotein, YaeC family [compost metagenome]
MLKQSLLTLAIGLFAIGAHAADALKIGTTAAFAIPLEAAVAEADKQGLKVELIEFSDWIAPNVTLASGDIDVNYFQHIPFLENAKAAAGFDLVPYAPGIINNVGLYSKQYKSFEQLHVGASVAIANDPINSGRGLQLLAKAGLITLKPGVGYKATEEDIIANPKNLKILQVEAVQLVRAYDDADLVQAIRPTSAWPRLSMPAPHCCSMAWTTRNTSFSS